MELLGLCWLSGVIDGRMQQGEPSGGTRGRAGLQQCNRLAENSKNLHIDWQKLVGNSPHCNVTGALEGLLEVRR